jgi:hypothetical protein
MKKIFLLFSLMLFTALTFAQTGCIFGDCKNGQGTFVWSDESKYTGNWVNAQRNGMGTLVWKSGDVYTGNWVNDQRDGQGTLVWKSGVIYAGNWKNNQRTGLGEFKYADGKVYKGNFSNGVLEGQGTMTYKNKKKFEGIWKENNAFSGTGFYEYTDGSYEGKLVNGKRDGIGVFYFLDGKKGTYTWVNGKSDEFQKAFLLYKKNEIEKELASDLVVAKSRKVGRCTSGDCENGTGISEIDDQNGYYSPSERNPIISTTFFFDKKKSEGQWKNGKLFNGTGYLFDAVIKDNEIKKTLYYGEVKDGKRFGEGRYVDENNNFFEGKLNENNEYISKSDPRDKYYSYEGGMMNGCYNGKGLLIFNEKYKKYKNHGQHFDYLTYKDIEYPGKQYEGIFENSRLIKGTILYDDGSKEETEKIDANNDKVTRWDKKGVLVFEGMRYINGSETVAFFTCQGDCTNGMGKKTDAYGNTYVGNWKNGLYEGNGKLTYAKQTGFDSDYYEGNWKNGLFDGLGEWKGNIGYSVDHGTGSGYLGNWSQGKKNGHGKYYITDVISQQRVTVETDFTDDQMANKGTTTTKINSYTADLKNQIIQERVANWHIENGKVLATIMQDNYKQNANQGLYYEFYKYEGEVNNIYSVHRMGTGTTYKTINDTNPITEHYIWDKNDKDYAASEAYSKDINSRCDKCFGLGHIWEKYTVGGGSYTTGGETMRSQSASTSGIVERSDGSKYIETTTTYGTYKNPTYTFNVAGHEKEREVTCPVCNGTGRKK